MSGPTGAMCGYCGGPRRPVCIMYSLVDSGEVDAGQAKALFEEGTRLAELMEQALHLSEEFITTGERWEDARDQYGAEFPAWSYGEPLLNVEEAGSVEAAESAVRDLAGRVALARRDYATLELRARASSQAAASREADGDLRRWAEEVSRALETLTAEVSSQDRAAIEQRAREMVESPRASRGRALLDQLRLDIQRANAAGRARQRRVEQAAEWRRRLSGLEGPEVVELDRELRQVAGGQAVPPPDMEQKVEEVVARATESTRAHALGVITEELENLGYVVEVDLETASARGSEMLLRKPEMEEYHVALQAEAGAALLHTSVVRETGDPGLDGNEDRESRDRQMERIWLQDFAAALAAAERRGVRGRAVERVEPGRVPVRTMAPLEGKPESKPGRKRRRSGRLRSRAG